MAIFSDTIGLLDSLGVTDVLLPFLLVFTLVFAALQKAKILGEEKKNFNIIIALVMGLSVVIPHVTGAYPNGFDAVNIINSVLPQISIVAIAFLTLLILAGLVGVEVAGKSFAGVFVGVALIIVVAVFGGTLGWWNSSWFYNVFGEESIAIVMMLLVFGIIIWFITSGDTKGQKMGKGIKSVFDFMAGK